MLLDEPTAALAPGAVARVATLLRARLADGLAVLVVSHAGAVRPTPWYEPRYAIPLTGIVLGSVLNAASLALDGILDGVVRERALSDDRQRPPSIAFGSRSDGRRSARCPP